MNADPCASTSTSLTQQASGLLAQSRYGEAIALYEQAIDEAPEIKTHYWHLGLLLLLQGQEAEAQTTWLLAMAEGEEAQIEQWSAELVQILDAEAARREALPDYAVAWAIRQHIREIWPQDLRNLLHIVWLAIQLETLTADDVMALGVIPALQSPAKSAVEPGLVFQVLDQVLKYFPPEAIALEFTEACLGVVGTDNLADFMAVVLPAAVRIAYEVKHPKLGADLLELYRRLDPNNVEILGHLSTCYQNASCFDDGIRVAQLRFDLAASLAEQIFSSHLLLRAYMTAGGYWQDALAVMERHKALMRSLVEAHPTALTSVETTRLFTASCFLPYFSDDLKANRSLQNAVMALCQENVQRQYPEQSRRFRQTPVVSAREADRLLKIGYLSHCLGRHSVGWLARWLFQYHDRDRVQLFGYFINNRQNDPLHDWYVNHVDQAHRISVESSQDTIRLAEKIYDDQLDILVDLDSLTLDLSCQILALKPAPIQVTWLGWDASGIPAIDYFIVDRYVIPDWAQDYYAEKLWYLPQTYIAVDGFETDIPSLRRDELGIAPDAVIYLSAQKGYKRHADTARLQMRVIKGVPNSYFLIKGSADQVAIQRFFEEIADEEGVARDRLRFLPEVPAESIHRADLQIADVVLDTYPYNGATTTLETLWMGVPLVTRVGDQFAARNSYTMLKNVGVEEGIAWTDEEYVEWGIRLGQDETLRQQIHWKLKQSRQTSPLWNAKQFTGEMENAYEEMWWRYHHQFV